MDTSTGGQRVRRLPDLDQARRFLGLLDENAESFVFQVATDAIPREKPSPDPLAKILRLAPDMLDALAVKNRHRGAVWVQINESFKNSRLAKDVTRVRAVFLDGDGQVTLQQLIGAALEPHIIVESSPGHVQAYWLVEGLPLEQFAGVQRRIAKIFGNCDSITDLCRVMRVPGFYWQKDPAAPFKVRIAHVNEQLPYTAEEIQRAFPPLEKEQPRHNGHAADWFELPNPPDPMDEERVAQLRAEHPETFDLNRFDGDQSRQDLALAGLAARLGLPPAGAWSLIVAVRDDRKAYRRDYIERTLQRAYAEQSSARHENKHGQASGKEGDALFDLSHDGLALDMGRNWQREARHVALWGRWLFWTGTRWEPDDRLLHMTRVRDYLRRRADALVRATKAKEIPGLDVERAEALAKSLRSANTVANVVGLARSNEELAATTKQWDADPWLLGTPAGTVDLRTGNIRRARQSDYIAKQTAIAPAPAGTPAPAWQAFLKRIFDHDPELVPFIRRALGYALTGLVVEHALLFCWGQGANGKGTLLNTASRILGDYAAVAPSDLLLVRASDRHPCDMAMLRGARLVAAQELAPGRAWDEPKLKSLTGGDPVTARFMRQDFFTYEPQFTLFVAGNHKPTFKTVDEAIRRRVLLVPFLQVIPPAERDKDLPKKLKAEWPAILRWMIDGCLAWQREGLAPPESARAATADYLHAEDTLGQWIEERCVLSPKVEFTYLANLYRDWCEWADARGLRRGTSKELAKRLDERGLMRLKKESGAAFQGIGLAEPRSEAAARCSRDANPDDPDDPELIGRIDSRGCAGVRARPYVDYGEHRQDRQPGRERGSL